MLYLMLCKYNLLLFSPSNSDVDSKGFFKATFRESRLEPGRSCSAKPPEASPRFGLLDSPKNSVVEASTSWLRVYERVPHKLGRDSFVESSENLGINSGSLRMLPSAGWAPTPGVGAVKASDKRFIFVVSLPCYVNTNRLHESSPTSRKR